MKKRIILDIFGFLKSKGIAATERELGMDENKYAPKSLHPNDLCLFNRSCLSLSQP